MLLVAFIEQIYLHFPSFLHNERFFIENIVFVLWSDSVIKHLLCCR